MAGVLLLAAIAIVRFEGGADTWAQSAGGKASITIAVRDGRVKLDVHDAPLSQVLAELARRAGFALDVRGNLAGRVSDSFDGLTPAATIRRLAGRNSYTIEFARAADGSLRVQQLSVIARAAAVRKRAKGGVGRRPRTRTRKRDRR